MLCQVESLPLWWSVDWGKFALCALCALTYPVWSWHMFLVHRGRIIEGPVPPGPYPLTWHYSTSAPSLSAIPPSPFARVPFVRFAGSPLTTRLSGGVQHWWTVRKGLGLAQARVYQDGLEAERPNSNPMSRLLGVPGALGVRGVSARSCIGLCPVVAQNSTKPFFAELDKVMGSLPHTIDEYTTRRSQQWRSGTENHLQMVVSSWLVLEFLLGLGSPASGYLPQLGLLNERGDQSVPTLAKVAAR